MKHQISNMPHNHAWQLIRTGFALGLLLSLAITTTVVAQVGGDYDLSWSTIDTGGKYSAGGPYWLGGAMGQPDAGSLSGGDFEISGGFWHIKAQYPTVVKLVAMVTHTNGLVGVVVLLVLWLIVISRPQHPKVLPTKEPAE